MAVVLILVVFPLLCGGIVTYFTQARINRERRAASETTPVVDNGLRVLDGVTYWRHPDGVFRAYAPVSQPGWRPTPGQVLGAGAIGFAAGVAWEHHHQQMDDLRAAESANYETTMNHLLHHPPGWQYPEAQAHHHHHGW
jgi:hypothetical protein